MADRAEPINAIVYAQYHLKGGSKNTLIGMGVGLLVVGGACAMFLSMNPRDMRDVAKAGTMVILAIQWLVLGLYGASRVSAAVRQDVTLGLIESHRLTPASPIAAAVGYVVGPPIQAIAMGVVLLLVGLGMALIGGVPVAYWLVANAMTLAFAATIWTLIALVSFTATNAAVLPIVAVGSVASSGMFYIVPAMSVLAAPLSGRSVFFGLRSTFTLQPAFVYTLIAQGLLAGLMLLAIARRYRNSDTPAFSVRLSLVLLTLWTAVTIIGLVQTPLFIPPSPYGRISDEDTTRLLGGLVSSFLVALVPLTAVARQMARQVTRGPGDAAAPGLPAWVLVGVCAVIACAPALTQYVEGFGGLGPGSALVSRVVGTFAVALAMFAGLALTLAWQFLAGRFGWLFGFLYILLPNAVPPLIDAAMHVDDTTRRSGFSELTSFSPLASLIMLWDRQPHDVLPGLIGQGALVLLPLMLYARRRAKLMPRTRGFAVELTPPPTAAG